MGSLCSGGTATDNKPVIVEEVVSKEIKVLLLGAGESGKSTIFKQMKILHQNGYTEQERIAFRDTVRGNILKAIKALIEASLAMDIPIEIAQNRQHAERFNEMDDDTILAIGKIWTVEMGKDIQTLWNDEGIKKTFARRNEFQLDDSTHYYMTDLPRISELDYVPSQEDVLRTRVKTTGVIEMAYEVRGKTVRMLDVGGQRNERKKWLHCFDGVHAVIFVTSAAEYDMRCYEDNETPRLQESLELFGETVNSKWFTETPIILFMNKIDLFNDKIKTSPITSMFPEYEGGQDAEKSIEYIKSKFIERSRYKDRTIVCHHTAATNTESLQTAFDAIAEILVTSKPTRTTV